MKLNNLSAKSPSSVYIARLAQKIDELEGVVAKQQETMKQQTELIFNLGRRIGQSSDPESKQPAEATNFAEQLQRISRDFEVRMRAVESEVSKWKLFAGRDTWM